MRILLLTLYYAPDVAANAVVMTELAEHLAKLGHQVTAVTSFPHYAANAIEPAYRGRLFQRDELNGVRILRTYLYTSPSKEDLRARLLNYLSFHFLSTAAAVLATRPDLILAPSPPLTIGVSAWAISRLKRVPYVYNVQDIYPDVAVRLGVLKGRRAIALFRRIESFVYRKAAAVSVLSEGFRRNLLAKGVPDAKVRVIPNSIDVEFVHPLPRGNAFAREQGLLDRFVVLYAGNIGLSQGLETLLDAAALLRDLPEAYILIVGNGTTKPALEARAAEMGLANVRFLPFQPRERLPEMYAAADASLVVLKQGIGAESVPSKAYTILASGRPLIAAVDADAETAQLVAEAGCGLVVPPEDPEALASAIRRLHRDAASRAEMGRRGREHVAARYAPAQVARQYEDLFREVMLGRKRNA